MENSNGSGIEERLGVQARPDVEAVTDAHTGLSYTYADIEANASALANYLVHELKMAKGDRVALLARNSIECLWAFFAVQKAGLILVPLNWILSPRELVSILQLTEPRVVIYQSTLAPMAAEIFPEYSFDRVLYFLEHGDQPPFEGENLQAILTGGKNKFERGYRLNPEDPLVISFTGGTTGPSKGAVISQRAVMYNMLSEAQAWKIKPGDVMPAVLPFFHIGGWHLVTLPTLYAGGRVILFRGFDPDLLLKWIEQERCRTVFAAPTMFEMISNSEAWWKTDLSSLEWVMSGAAPCPRNVMLPYWQRELPFVQGYGITEGGPNNLYMPWYELNMEQVKTKWRSVGKPFPYCFIRIVDENGGDVQRGERGELLLSGPIIFSGYWNSPEKTEETLVDGWVHTGDIVQQDEEDFFYIVDRKKDMYITGGEKVYPSEIEKALAEHPAVQEAAVVGVYDPQWGEVGKAFIVAAKEQELSVDDLVEFLQDRLARYKIPKHFSFEESIAKTGMGKVLKRELRETGK